MAGYEEDQLREIQTTLNSLAVLVKGVSEQLTRIESTMKSTAPTVTERIQAVSGSKSSGLSNLPSIGSLTTK